MNFKISNQCIRLLILLVVVSSYVGVNAADRDAAAATFERAYARWLEQCNAPEVSIRSDNVIYTLPAYKEIVDLGYLALPAIKEKLADSPMLARAVFDISRQRLSREQKLALFTHAQKIAFARQWIEHGEAEAASKFANRKSEYRNAKQRGSATEKSAELEKIRDIGTAALPHLFASIAEGESEMIPIVAELTKGAISPNATVEECAAWWAANKPKWTFPK